jgi:hypothetical protein
MFLKTQLGLSLAPVDAKIPITSPNAAPAPIHIPNAFNILVGGTPAHNLATRMTSMSIQNSTNAPGIYLVPGQFKVLGF